MYLLNHTNRGSPDPSFFEIFSGPFHLVQSSSFCLIETVTIGKLTFQFCKMMISQTGLAFKLPADIGQMQGMQCQFSEDPIDTKSSTHSIWEKWEGLNSLYWVQKAFSHLYYWWAVHNWALLTQKWVKHRINQVPLHLIESMFRQNSLTQLLHPYSHSTGPTITIYINIYA